MNTIQHKYAIGDTVYYVSSNYNRHRIEIIRAEVRRILYGVPTTLRLKDAVQEEPIIQYSLSDYMTIAEPLLFATIDEAKANYSILLNNAVVLDREHKDLELESDTYEPNE